MGSITTLVTESVADLTMEKPEEEKKMTIRERIAYIKEVITVEPIIACYVLASFICNAALNDLELEKACRVNANFTSAVCDDIIAGRRENLTEEFDVIQTYVANMHSWQTPVTSVMPLILVLFIGSFSDRKQLRKPFMLIPIFGEFFSVAACILCVVFMDTWPLEALGVSQTVIPSIFGSQPMLVMALFAYIADVSSLEMRTLRVGVIQIVINVCLLVGLPLGGALYKIIGYIGVFCVACVLFIIGFAYGLLRIKEKRSPMSVFNDGVKSCLLDVFSPVHAIDTFGLLLVKKKGTSRLYIAAIMLIMLISSGVLVAEFSVLFLFSAASYQWTAVEYIHYYTIASALYLIGAAVALPLFTRVLKLHDLLIMAISFADKVVATVILAFATTPTWLYIATVVGIIQREATIGIRSIITKVVTEDDMGKAQSLFAICEAIAPAILGPIFNQMYSYTQKDFKGAVFLIGAALFVVTIVITMALYIRQKRAGNKVSESKEANGDSNKTIPADDVAVTRM